MSKTSPGKYKKASTNSKLHKGRKKRIPTIKNFVVVFASNIRFTNPRAKWSTTGGDICIYSVTSSATSKEEPRVAGSTFDGWWGGRWLWDIAGGAENEKWALDIEEDGKIWAHGDVTVDRSESGVLNGGWILVEMTAEFQMKKI